MKYFVLPRFVRSMAKSLNYNDNINIAKAAQAIVAFECNDDANGGSFVEKVHYTLQFANPQINRDDVIRIIQSWNVERGAGCFMQMKEQPIYTMIVTAPSQYHEVHFLLHEDKYTTLSERLAFSSEKKQKYAKSRRCNFAANFCVVAHSRHDCRSSFVCVRNCDAYECK